MKKTGLILLILMTVGCAPLWHPYPSCPNAAYYYSVPAYYGEGAYYYPACSDMPYYYSVPAYYGGGAYYYPVGE